MIFSLSFLVALTGAMSPGPLLTYTIIKSAKTARRGYLMGLWVITGHAILEVGVIVLLLVGLSFALKNILVVRGIGIVGGAILLAFGVSVIRDVYQGRISARFLSSPQRNTPGHPPDDTRIMENPVLGGMVVSMSNPYWWVWWATIGLAFMVQFDLSFTHWPALVAFFLGHEAGDLAWYLVISVLAFFGLRRMNRKAYSTILACCGIFMILFGLFLGISPFPDTAIGV
jgi:threonine/homoserine/homoserine lactone efflux protein